jgi:predicted PurR-regulated permease PerM
MPSLQIAECASPGELSINMATAEGPIAAETTVNNEEVEILRGSVQAGMIAQFIIAIAAAVGLIYLLKLVLITVLTAALLAFALDPLVVALAHLKVPRAAGSAIALALLIGLTLSLTFFFYNRAVEFVEELPRFSTTIRDDLQKLQTQANKFENSTRSILPGDGKKAIPVQVQEAPGLTKLITTGASQFGDLALAISFVPFLIYFMLTWKTHVHSATLQVFPKEKRLVAYRTIGRISEMVRSFIAGNLLVGLLNAVASTAIFYAVHLPYFYFLGAISAFVGLVPYLGIAFALLAPIAAGMGVLTKSELAVVFFSVVALHLITMNVLYPKVIGRRLRLNPLAVALSLLFWAWIWGAFGLVLAVPLIASTKIVCDYIEPLQPLGAWLGD